MTIDAAEVVSAPRNAEEAGLGRRLVASIIDFGIVCLVFCALAIILAAVVGPWLGVPRGSVIFAAAVVLWLIVAWFYGALMEGSSGQSTVGKALLDLVVTDANGNRLSYRKAMVRQLGKTASVVIVMAGFIMIAFTARKQGLHDLVAGSLVVVKE